MHGIVTSSNFENWRQTSILPFSTGTGDMFEQTCDTQSVSSDIRDFLCHWRAPGCPYRLYYSLPCDCISGEHEGWVYFEVWFPTAIDTIPWPRYCLLEWISITWRVLSYMYLCIKEFDLLRHGLQDLYFLFSSYTPEAWKIQAPGSPPHTKRSPVWKKWWLQVGNDLC